MNLTGFNFKKIALVIGFLILAIIIGYFIFIIFFKSNSQVIPTNTGNEQTQTGTLPESGVGNTETQNNEGGQLPDSTSTQNNNNGEQGKLATVEDISSDMSINAADSNISTSGQMRFYNENDGKFYKIDETGKAVALADKKFVGAQNVTWSETSNKAIIEFPDGSKIRYNFDTKEQVTLPKHWQDFAFSPSGDKIVAKSMALDPDNRWLVVSNDDGSQAKQIEELGENGDKVISSWSPNNQTVAMYVENIDFDRKEVYFIGQNKENFKTIVTEGRGFEPQWSPRGDELLYSVYSSRSEYKPELWITNAQGDNIGANRRPLEINTWANKCTFSSSSLYCAVPQSLEKGSGMFPELANNTPDILYRIDPSTGNKEMINLGNSSYTMKNLTVSPDGSYLYFTDSSTNRLRRIKLK